MLLNKHNLSVARFVSSEVSRYTMQAIECSPAGTVATDGHRLALVTLPAELKDSQFPAIEHFEPTNGTTGTFLLSSKTALEVSKALPKNPTIPICGAAAVAVGEYSTTLAVTDLANPRIFTEEKMQGNYPNWRAVVPSQDDLTSKYKLTIGFDAKYLMEAAKLALDFGGKGARVTVRIKDAKSAVVLEGKNSDTAQTMTQLLMPFALGKD